MRCILCDHNKLKVISPQVRDSKKHKIIKCNKCGHIQLNPIPTQEEENKFYDENMQDKNINDVGTIQRAYKKMLIDTTRRTNLVTKLTHKGKKILEIGSGHGFFLEAMRKLGYEIIGIDISKGKRKISKKITKVKILDVNINEKIPNIGKFDTIVIIHTLEHIADPINFLKNAKKLLNHKGKIIVEVPNCNDFNLNFNKAYEQFYWERAHIHYFTPKSLRAVFRRASFKSKIIGVQRYSIENMFSWRLTNKPQLHEPTYNLPKPYDWIESYYKKKLEKSLKSDTIIGIGSNNKN